MQERLPITTDPASAFADWASRFDPERIDYARYAGFADHLLGWFREHGRHHLPWQHPRTAYTTWLSEIMLQQTQVTTVIPYYERFVTRFPDVQSLAEAPIDDVLALWSGLGYYARARNLHRSAVLICEQYEGQIPKSAETLVTLPGIGESTANAIVAQAYDMPAAILDGNVKRILARQIALPTPPQTSTRPLWSLAQHLTPSHSAADYTQAIMDLGALVCLKKPLCQQCPVQTSCMSYEHHWAALIPVKKAKKAKPQRQQDFYLYYDRSSSQIWLQKRPSTGIWGGLWCLPEAPLEAFVRLVNPQPLPEIQHSFTHYDLQISPLLAELSRESLKQATQVDTEQSDTLGGWFSPADALKKGLPAPIREVLKQFFNHTNEK